MLATVTVFAGGMAGGISLRNAIDNPPEIPPIASGPTGPLAKDLVFRAPEVVFSAQPTPSRILAADSTPSSLSTSTPTSESSSTPSPTTTATEVKQTSSLTAIEVKATPTPLRQMVVTGNVDAFLGPGERKVGYFVPGQKFTPTGVSLGDYIQVSDGKNTLWVKSGGSYQAVDEVPQVASRPPTQAAPPPTRAVEPPPTATRQPEIARTFPKEIRSVEGLEVYNLGTKYGLDISDGGFKDRNGNYCPSTLLGCEAFKGFNDLEMKENNRRYVQAMFDKYRNRPDGGNGLTLRIVFYDNPARYLFRDKGYFRLEGFFYKYAQQVGNAIEYHLGVNDNFNYYNNQQRERLSHEINNSGLVYFLNGNHESMMNFVSPTKPRPPDLNALIYPQKLMVRR